MPKTKVERNRAYRQRLRAKARAWDHIVAVLPKDMRLESLHVDNGQQICRAAAVAREIAETLEQANG